MLNILNASRGSIIFSIRRSTFGTGFLPTLPAHHARPYSQRSSPPETQQGEPNTRPSRYIFVNNIPHELTKEELMRYLPKSTQSIILPRVQSATNMFAHLTFETAQAASDALLHHNRRPAVIGTHALRMTYTRSVPPSQFEPSSTLFVGRLPLNASKESIATLIGVSAKCVEKIVQQDHSSSAMVHYPSVKAASCARHRMRSQPPIVDGAPIYVEYAWVIAAPSSNLRYLNYYGPLEEIRDMLAPFQETFIGIQSDEPSGRGFMIFTHTMAAKEARERLNGQRTAGGHSLKLDFARTQVSPVRRTRANVPGYAVVQTPPPEPVLEEAALEPLPPAGRYLAFHRSGIRQYYPQPHAAHDLAKSSSRKRCSLIPPTGKASQPPIMANAQLAERHTDAASSSVALGVWKST